MRLQGSEIVVRTLIEQGTDLVFGYPGAAVIDIYDALWIHKDDIRHVLVAHEQGAAHAADGYARATGRVGVCIATSGPGATNLVTGIATAFLDSVPMVIVCGNVSQRNIATDAFQEIDITGITLPITKHNYFVSDVGQLADTLREAFYLSQEGRPGPVLIDITKNVQNASAEWDERPRRVCQRLEPTCTQAELEAAAAAINEARRPYVYFGGGAITSGASEEVSLLADTIDAPIGCSLMGLSGVPTNHPRFLGMAGMHGHLASTIALRESDVLIALGVRFNDRATGERDGFKMDATIVRIDADPSEIAKNTYDDYALTGDLKLTLRRLLPLLEHRVHASWSEYVAGMRLKEEQGADRRYGLTPKNAMCTLNKHLSDDTIVVTDVGQHQMWAAQHLCLTRPRSFVTNGGLGTMGFGLGASIGAALGTGRRTVLVCGDGGLGMCVAELATAVSEQVDVVILLMNNRTLGMVRQWQTLFYGKRYAGTSLEGRKTDYVALAKAFGADGRRVETLEELDEALSAGIAQHGPFIIDCAIATDELVLPMIPAGGTLYDLFDKVGE